MKKGILAFVMVIAVLCLLSGMAMAMPSFLGISGNIMTPNDQVLEVGDFNANLHSLQLDEPVTVIGATIGLMDDFEAGIANYNPSADGVSSETIFNLKYSVLKETGSRPSLTVGLVDATGALDIRDDPGFFAVVGKNITRAGSDLTGEPIGTLKGYLGYGGGIYNGFFVAADYLVSPKVHVIGELINGLELKSGINKDVVFNAAVRVKVTDNLSADLALINGDDLGFGITYAKIGL
ncbi:MAG: hypothetical protein ACYC0V_02670 [Armatimonadota bacterium]